MTDEDPLPKIRKLAGILTTWEIPDDIPEYLMPQVKQHVNFLLWDLQRNMKEISKLCPPRSPELNVFGIAHHDD